MLKKLVSILDVSYLLLIVLTYGLGISLSHYLGNPIRWSSFWNGILWLIGIVLSGFYFKEYFGKRSKSEFRRELLEEKYGDDSLQETNALKFCLLVGIAWLAVSLIPLINSVIEDRISALTLVFILLHLGFTYLVSIFPGYLSKTGLLEFINAIILANLIPAIAFTLQSNGLHRLLLLLTFPLMFFFFALFIIITFQECERSEDTYLQSVVKSMGILKVVNLHNLLIVFGYLIMIMGVIFHVQWKLIWPQLMTLPIGAIQIWQISHVTKGGKPAISPLVLNAISTAGFTTYFLLLTLWL